MVYLLMHIWQGVQHMHDNQLLAECRSLLSNPVIEDSGDC